MFGASNPNLTAAGFITVITAIYVWINWDYFTVAYRIRFIVLSVFEILILAYVPVILVVFALLFSTSKSEIERGDEGCIRGVPTVLHLVPGSFFWHYYNSMTALMFTWFINLCFMFVKSHS